MLNAFIKLDWLINEVKCSMELNGYKLMRFNGYKL